MNKAEKEKQLARLREERIRQFIAQAETSDEDEEEEEEEEEEEAKLEAKLEVTTAKVMCTCKIHCLKKFDLKAVHAHRVSLREMSKDERELYIMENMERCGAEQPHGQVRQRTRYRYLYECEAVCKTVFCYINNVGMKTLRAIQEHLTLMGPVARIHRNKGRKPHHALNHEEVKFCVDFLTSYSEINGMPMPAEAAEPDEEPAVILPSSLTKKDIHTMYTEACKENKIRALGLTSFKGVWQNCVPFIKTAGPQDETCYRCEVLKKMLIESKSEQEKQELTETMKEHVQAHAEEQRKRKARQRRRSLRKEQQKLGLPPSKRGPKKKKTEADTETQMIAQNIIKTLLPLPLSLQNPMNPAFNFGDEDSWLEMDDKNSRHNPDVSIVVHVRGLPMHVTEEDIVNAVQHFGPVEYVMMLPRKNQALVEFQDVKASKSCVAFASTNQLYIGGEPAFFNYSTSQKISRHHNDGDGPMANRGIVAANNILLFTVLNAQYPITVDVMHTICSSHGRVDKIVIFKKFHVQCMVQFDSIESAKRAKDQLAGCDIYSGCCTLKVEFAKTNELNVRTNGTESWDYTVPNNPPGMDMQRKNPPLLADPRYTAAPTPFSGNRNTEFTEYPADPTSAMGSRGGPMGQRASNYGNQGGYGDQGGYEDYSDTRGVGRGGQMRQGGYMKDDMGGYGQRGGGIMQTPVANQRMGGGMGAGMGAGMAGGMGAGMGGGMGATGMYDGGYMGGGQTDQGMGMGQVAVPTQGCVLMVYGLDATKINCDRLFNLLCLYGNVNRIYFLKTKEGTAMVQMGDKSAVERAMYNCAGVDLFGQKLVVTQSKQAYLQDVQNPHELPDGSCAFKDYTGSRNNRFSTPESAAKNRIMHPTEILHYFNAPPNITEDDLRQIFTDAGATSPSKVLQFQGKSEKSSAGLVEFNGKEEALEALVVTNHTSCPNPGGRPYVFKLCFSQSNIRSKE